jgi:indole-3-glycerol phosphate synthase
LICFHNPFSSMLPEESPLMTILDEIFAHKRLEVEMRKRALPLAELRLAAGKAPLSPSFIRALRRSQSSPALIAEVKFASPSKGILVENPAPVSLAETYAANGAAAISVLTDEKYFRGSLGYLQQIHAALPGVPLLRKDFIYDPYQVYEARLAGASAVLLIVAQLDPAQLAGLHTLILSLGMAALVEVHDRTELDAALRIKELSLLGVNNRDLHTFNVDLQACLDMRRLVPADICFVAESGIHTAGDVQQLRAARVDAMLVGEALVTAPNIPEEMRTFTNPEN